MKVEELLNYNVQQEYPKFIKLFKALKKNNSIGIVAFATKNKMKYSTSIGTAMMNERYIENIGSKQHPVYSLLISNIEPYHVRNVLKICRDKLKYYEKIKATNKKINKIPIKMNSDYNNDLSDLLSDIEKLKKELKELKTKKHIIRNFLTKNILYFKILLAIILLSITFYLGILF